MSLSLPASQQRLMKTLESVGKPLVTVLTVGSSLNVPEGDAQLLAWYPGQAGGTALARVLFGDVVPSGHLPVTFYRGLEDLPEFTDYHMAGRTYRYYQGEPLYPFGYGLSYTTFALSDLTLDADSAALTVKNTGDRDAETVVQVYVQPVDCGCAPPNPSLAGFARVAVSAGREKRAAVKLNPDAWTVVQEDGSRVPFKGVFRVWAGLSQPDARSLALTGLACLETQFNA